MMTAATGSITSRMSLREASGKSSTTWLARALPRKLAAAAARPTLSSSAPFLKKRAVEKVVPTADESLLQP